MGSYLCTCVRVGDILQVDKYASWLLEYRNGKVIIAVPLRKPALICVL